MSSEAPMYDDQLKELEDQVADCIRAMDRLSGDQRLEKYAKATELLKRVNKTFHLFKVEVRMLEGADQGVYEKKASEHSAAIQQLKEQLNQKRAGVHLDCASTRADVLAAQARDAASSMTMATMLVRGSGRCGFGVEAPRFDGKDEARAATGRISNTQKNTLGALTEAERELLEAEEMGTVTVGKLGDQTRKIRVINDNLDEMQSEVNRAKKELNAFIRRMMTDKIILCFGVLIIIGIIAIVVLRIQNPPAKDKAPPPPMTTIPGPPSPTRA